MALCSSCEKSPEQADGDAGKNGATYTRRQSNSKAVANHRHQWRAALRAGRAKPGSGAGQEADENPLAAAEKQLDAGEFAYLAERLFEEAGEAEDEAEKQYLLECLAELAGRQGFGSLPTWYGMIDEESLKDALAGALGAEAHRRGKHSAEALLGLFDSKQEKAAFMVGHGKALAAVEPNLAFDTYLGWGFKNGMEALEKFPQVIAKLAADADFAAMDGKIPRTEQHVAVASREALYARWGEAEPVGMVTHVVEKGYFGPSLVSALQAWYAKDASATEAWMREVVSRGSTNPAWDSVRGAKARIAFEKKDYAAAWKQMMEINDFPTKRHLQARIFNAWAKADAKNGAKALKEAQKEFVRLHGRDLEKMERERKRGK